MKTDEIDPFESFKHSGDYGSLVHAKLEDVITNGTPSLTASVIRKVLENLIITEWLAEAGGVDIGDQAKRTLVQKEYQSIQEELDRAVGEFIGSILSREGG